MPKTNRSSDAASGGFTPLDEFSFHPTLAGTAGPALVFFTGQGCRSCRAWRQLLTRQRETQPELKIFEVDAGHAQALAREFGVFHLPALFLYRDGHFHCPLHSEARPEAFAAALRAALAGPAHEPP
jgi:thioredoxin-like negative regulator of GroEL